MKLLDSKILTFISIFIALAAVKPVQAEAVLRMATTTSTENSGLLAVLNPSFETAEKVKIDVIAVGSGKALKLGENGDVDVLFVHAPEDEEKFVAAGFGVDRKPVMHNDFVLVGPKSDPEKIASAAGIVDALQKISRGRTPFISRGDDSGTHKKELELWKKAGITPQGEWYLAVGQAMGAVLRMAEDKQAYALTDRGTFLSYRDKVELVIVSEGSEPLLNPYHVIAINPKIHPHSQYALAKKYIDYVTGAEGQKIIAGFKKDGQPLFHPDAMN
ncbi:MAG: substrate-binding domain-containing protein [Gammaproteobacteria bacterium]